MIYAQVNVPFDAEATGQFPGQVPTGLVGTITVGVYTAPSPAGTIVLAPTTAGITELAGPTYKATLTVTVPVPSGVVRWAYSGLIAEEDLVVSTSPVPGAKGTLTPALNGLPIKGIPAFEPGNTVTLAASITVSGIPTDPAALALNLKLEDPTGAITTPTATHDGTGLFHWDLQSPAPGRWIAEWDCPSLGCGSGPIEFMILPSIP